MLFQFAILATYLIVGILSKQMHLHNDLRSAVDKMQSEQVFLFIQEEKNPLIQ